jgi:signal transduction histidine kinase
MNERPAGAIQPLFASSHHLWLRIWVTTQAAATLVGVNVAVRSPALSGGGFRASPVLVLIVAVLLAYHIVGVLAFSWMMKRPAYVSLFVPLGWAIIVAAISTHSAFATLIFGAILQGFIFLPFRWAMTTLTAAIVLLMCASVSQTGMPGPGLRLLRAVAILTTGVTFGSVMLYIHRANRDALVRTRLLDQLDAAQRDLADQARQAGAQEERQRLAHDIHDTLAQGFASVIKHLEAIELSFASSSADNAVDTIRKAEPHLTNAQSVSRTSLTEIRRLVLDLRPPQLVAASLQGAIERLVTQWRAANDIGATTAVHDIPHLQPHAEVILLRATQESLSNVARHAKASHVDVSLDCVDGLVLLSVEDDGCGISQADSEGTGGLGILGMRERVRRFGGRVLIESRSPSGTSVTVALPLEAVAADPQ